MELSGLVAILNEDGSVREIRDLGPEPVVVKPGRVVPVEDQKPTDGKEYAPTPVSELTASKSKVVREWREVIREPEPPSLDDRITALEQRLAALETARAK